MYELGEGFVVQKLNKIFQISSVKFSLDGNYIYVGGLKGPIII